MKDKRIYFKKTSGNKRLEYESLVVSKVFNIIEVTLNYGTDVLQKGRSNRGIFIILKTYLMRFLYSTRSGT